MSNENLSRLSSFFPYQLSAMTSLPKKKYGERIESFSNKAARELLSLMERKRTNLSLALDVTTKREFLEIADKVGPYICLLKVSC